MNVVKKCNPITGKKVSVIYCDEIPDETPLKILAINVIGQYIQDKIRCITLLKNGKSLDDEFGQGDYRTIKTMLDELEEFRKKSPWWDISDFDKDYIERLIKGAL